MVLQPALRGSGANREAALETIYGNDLAQIGYHGAAFAAGLELRSGSVRIRGSRRGEESGGRVHVMTDEPPPDRPEESVMDFQSEDERAADAEAVYGALSETDSLDANQLSGKVGIEVARVDAALDRLQRDGRVHLTRLSDGTVVASKREIRG
jgi:hypothetical protein